MNSKLFDVLASFSEKERYEACFGSKKSKIENELSVTLEERGYTELKNYETALAAIAPNGTKCIIAFIPT